MPKLQITPMGLNNQTDRQLSHKSGALPLFYMSDYSIMGLRVSKYHETISMLEELNYRLDKGSTGVELVTDNLGQLEQVIRFLRDNRIQCDLSDTVTQIYQG